MERKWQMFPDNEGGWTAMVPVENLSTPGSYAFLLRDGKRERRQKVRIRTNNLPIQNITLRGSKAGLHATETEKTKVRSALQTITAEKLNSGPSSFPARGRSAAFSDENAHTTEARQQATTKELTLEHHRAHRFWLRPPEPSSLQERLKKGSWCTETPSS